MQVERNDPNAALTEIRKVRETAERLANGNYPADADHVRVFAGLIQHLAEQVERLAPASKPVASSSRFRSSWFTSSWFR